MSKKKILEFDAAKVQIKEHLAEWLESQGIECNRNRTYFRSFYGEREDANPSVHIFRSTDGEILYHDFSTHRTGDIFVANNVINGKPLFGKEFIHENMKPLADQFGIEFEIKELSEEDLYKMNMKTTYSLIKDIVIYNMRYGEVDPVVAQYMLDRNIQKDEDSVKYGIGYVPNNRDFINELVDRGIPENFLREAGIKDYIFNSNNLLFCIPNEYNSTIGFAARNCYFKKEDSIGSKYYNTENNILYNKKQVLYNINNAIRKRNPINNSLYITEGYTDAIALDKIGLKAVALGGTAFTHDHIYMMQYLGETDIVFLLDGDEGGIENTARAITEVMEGVQNFRTRIVELQDGVDPEEFVRTKGPDALLALEHLSAFEWRLKLLEKVTDLDGHERAESAIPLIVNEASELKRDQMCNKVAELCNVPLAVIRKEVRRIIDKEEMILKERKNAIIESLITKLKRTEDDYDIILKEAQSKIRDLTVQHKGDIFGIDEYISDIDEFDHQGMVEDSEDMIHLWRMPLFEQRNYGSLKGKLLMLGGQPNAGKTAMLINWAINVLRSGDAAPQWGIEEDPSRRNNVCIIFHTVDDTRGELMPKLIAALAAEYNREVFINAMLKPVNYRFNDLESLLYARKVAISMLRKWAIEGRLIIKDMKQGSASLDTAEKLVSTYKEKYPDRQIIYIADNMYNFNDLAHYEDEKKRITERIGLLRNEILTPYDTCGFITVEYRKGTIQSNVSNQALNELIKESKSLEYRAHWVGHLLNELDSLDKTDMYFWDPAIPVDKRTAQNRSPIITLRVSKNKISDYKGTIYYWFIQRKALHLEVTKEDLAAMEPALQARLRRDFYIDGEEIIGDRNVSTLNFAGGSENEIIPSAA